MDMFHAESWFSQFLQITIARASTHMMTRMRMRTRVAEPRLLVIIRLREARLGALRVASSVCVIIRACVESSRMRDAARRTDTVKLL